MRHAVGVLIAGLCLSAVAYCQTADELIEKNIQAKGGIDRETGRWRRIYRGHRAGKRPSYLCA
jgi:hypothetical protein